MISGFYHAAAGRTVAGAAAACWLLTALAVHQAQAAPADTPAKSAKTLRHVVLFKFKDATTAEQVDEVVRAFKALKGKIDVMLDFEYGTDVSVENRSQGFTHCFIATFRDEKSRDTYLHHPDHQAFGTLVGPRLDKVLVVDFWVEK